MIAYILCFIIAPLILLQARVLYFVVLKNGKLPRKHSRVSPAKTLIILGSGGHTAEILRVVTHMSTDRYSPRIYVQARTDKISTDKVRNLEGQNTDYRLIEISRSREVRQSYLTAVWTTLVATLDSLPVILKEKPDLILCNGPGTCVPLCLVAFFLKVLFVIDARIVFIESFCRVKTYSLTGKILYYLADFVIVQWPYLSKPVYNRAVYL